MAKRIERRLGIVEAAIRFAAEAHAGQLRKDRRTPYVVHPVGVLRYLSSDLGVTDPAILAAAVLHDVLEDTATTRRVLLRRFGREVADWVEALTVPPQFHGPDVPDAVKTRILVRDLRQMPWPAVLVKLSDRWDNLRDMTNSVWKPDKRRRYVHQTRRLLETVRQRWKRQAPPAGLRPYLLRGYANLARVVNRSPRPPTG
jgi:(p)ppGpp synthase/HD superfamily hydrolase